MLLQRTLCWFFLMMINIPLLFLAAIFSFANQLYDMPFDIWNNVTEYFSDDS